MRKNAAGAVVGSTTYYPAAGAMRVDSTLYYVLKDQLGSASVVLDANGNVVGEQRYYPFGETRVSSGNMFTDRLYTGQRELTGLGLYNYNARFYSPTLGRFIQADTIVPGAGNPQAYNRYSYVLNNPIKYIDPSGHMQVEYYQGAYLSIKQMNKMFPSTQRSSTTSIKPVVIPIAPNTSTQTSITPKITSTPTYTPTSTPSSQPTIQPTILSTPTRTETPTPNIYNAQDTTLVPTITPSPPPGWTPRCIWEYYINGPDLTSDAAGIALDLATSGTGGRVSHYLKVVGNSIDQVDFFMGNIQLYYGMREETTDWYDYISYTTDVTGLFFPIAPDAIGIVSNVIHAMEQCH